MPKSLNILIAAHKPYWIPADPMYLPVLAGAACDGGRADIPGFARDDSGDNISLKNPRYSELTVLYWGWKNLDCDYLGLAHYRRHFAGDGKRGVIGEREMREYLAKAPVVVPTKRHYFIESIESHYSNTFDVEHLNALREAIDEVSPEYREIFEGRMKGRSAHIYNMFVMRRDYLDAYCSWLFAVLEAAERRLDFTGMSAFEARVIGRISERLLDTWLEFNGVQYAECPVTSTELVNWPKKISAFLAAKFFGKKYTESF